MFSCHKCKKTFVSNQRLKYHLYDAKIKCDEKNIKIIDNKKVFSCEVCGKIFTRFTYLKNHKLNVHTILPELQTEIKKISTPLISEMDINLIKETAELKLKIEQLVSKPDTTQKPSDIKENDELKLKIGQLEKQIISNHDVTEKTTFDMDLIKENTELKLKIEQLEKLIVSKPDSTKQIEPSTVNIAIDNSTANNLINISNTCNVGLVKLNSFGNENLDYIDKSLYSLCMQLPRTYMSTLIKEMHYHPDHPENHNMISIDDEGKEFKIYHGDDGYQTYSKKETIVLTLKHALNTSIEQNEKSPYFDKKSLEVYDYTSKLVMKDYKSENFKPLITKLDNIMTVGSKKIKNKQSTITNKQPTITNKQPTITS